MTNPGTKSADAIVIGGGVMGASIAYYLAHRKFGRIRLLERETLGAGSTGRSVAGVDLFTQHPPVAELHVRSLRAIQNSVELYGDEAGWEQCGHTVLTGPETAEGARDAVRVVNAAGGRVELLTPDEYRQFDPAAVCGDVGAIRWAPEGGYFDPMLFTNTLVNAAKRLGVTLHQNEPVLELLFDDQRITGVRTKSGEISTGVVVVVTGPWTGDFLRTAGIDLPLRPCRHFVSLIACPPEVSPRVGMMDMANMVYARPETVGLNVCGSLDLNAGHDWVGADAECPPPTTDYEMWIWERMVRRYPGMESGQPRQGWSGIVTISPDNQPMMGRLPLEGLYCACGFSGGGMKISPAVGETLADLIVGDEPTRELLYPLRPTRFSEGQSLEAAYSWGFFS